MSLNKDELSFIKTAREKVSSELNYEHSCKIYSTAEIIEHLQNSEDFAQPDKQINAKSEAKKILIAFGNAIKLANKLEGNPNLQKTDKPYQRLLVSLKTNLANLSFQGGLSAFAQTTENSISAVKNFCNDFIQHILSLIKDLPYNSKLMNANENFSKVALENERLPAQVQVHLVDGEKYALQLNSVPSEGDQATAWSYSFKENLPKVLPRLNPNLEPKHQIPEALIEAIEFIEA